MIKKRLYLYYFFLLLILCTWFDTLSAPPLPFRVCYLFALFAPAFICARNYLVPIIICFTTLGTYGISCSYMPTEKWIYLLLITLSLLFSLYRLKNVQRPPLLMVVFCIYIWSVDLLKGGTLVNIDYCVLIVILSFFFVSKDGGERMEYMIAFWVITITLGLFFLTYGQSSYVEVSEEGQRSWVDPNYFGCICGMGVVIAFNAIINKLLPNIQLKLLAVIAIAIGFIMLVMNASRGAFLSVCTSIIIVTFFSNAKLSTKIGVSILLLIGVYTMYTIGVFDLLSARFMNGDDTGNGRTIIWQLKLMGYMGLSTFEKIFGIGYQEGFYLATPGGYGFHNDYIAFLVDYGLIGLILFLCLMIHPLILVAKQPLKRPIVLSMCVFLLLCCMTLEPFTFGGLTFWYFYMYIILLSKWSNT